jgi:hypothetical protein
MIYAYLTLFKLNLYNKILFIKIMSAKRSQSLQPNVSKENEEEVKRMKFIETHSDPSAILERVVKSRNGKVIGLDIDECTATGDDGNDIPRIIQEISTKYNSIPLCKQLDIFKRIINPKMIQGIQELRARGVSPFIFFYTNKGRIVEQFSTPAILKDRLVAKGFFMEGRYKDTLKFQAGNLLDSLDYLSKQVVDNIDSSGMGNMREKLALLRNVAAITYTASIMLGLPYAAPVYISSGYKDMRRISSDMHIENYRGKVYLFDDRASSHAENLSMSPEEAQMVTVAPFDYHMIPREEIQSLRESLERYAPLPPTFPSRSSAMFRSASQISSDWPMHRMALSSNGWLPYADKSRLVDNPNWNVDSIAGERPVSAEVFPRNRSPAHRSFRSLT